MDNGSRFKALLIAGSTACWYWTSSKNAVATQRLVENKFEMPTAALSAMAALTALQLLGGVVLCIVGLHLLPLIKKVFGKEDSTSKSDLNNDKEETTTTTTTASTAAKRSEMAEIVTLLRHQLRPGSPERPWHLLVGSLHFIGSFCTNMGFAHGSASLVQVVKLLEPIETLLLTAAVNILLLHTPHGVTVPKSLAVLVIIGGTSLLLSQKGVQPKIASVLWAIGSGVALASRNVATKSANSDTVKHRCAAATKPDAPTNTDSSNDWTHTARAGIQKFLSITFIASIPAVLCFLLTEVRIVVEQTDNSPFQWIANSPTGFQAVIFHAAYNMASIMVLSLVSAPTHSLLNVGKRICNVLVAAFVFQVPLGMSGYLGLLIAAAGGYLYKNATSISDQLKMQYNVNLDDLFRSCCWNQRTGKPRMLRLATVVLAAAVTQRQYMAYSKASVAYSKSNALFVRTLMTGDEDATTGSSATHIEFDLKNPVWPEAPPVVKKSCRVVFKNKDLSLCHIVPWGANFGDELGPPIVKRILELHFGCSTENLPVFDMSALGRELQNRTGHPEVKNCFMSVGSLWRMVMPGDHIWGTGAAFDDVIRMRCKGLRHNALVDRLTIHSARGPLSTREISKNCGFAKDTTIEPAGDAGFLVPFIFPNIRKQKLDTSAWVDKKEFCVVPHHQDRMHPILKKVPGDQILTVQQSWQNMTFALQGCRNVVSTSLHGIIIAEALGIASRRMRLSGRPGDFKFDDFYSSYRGQEPEIANSNLSHVFDTMVDPLPFLERDAYARRVLATFPIHEFEVVDSGDTTSVQ